MTINKRLLPLLLSALLLGASSLASCDFEEPAEDMPVPLPFDYNQENPGEGDGTPREGDGTTPPPAPGANQDDPNDPGTPPGQGQDPPPGPPSTTAAIDGDPCTQDSDCQSGLCLQDPEWPGGYCTTIDCDTRADCADEGDQNACLVSHQSTNFCIRLCDPANPNSCRQGYDCQEVGGEGAGWCAPGIGDINSDSGFPFQMNCANTVSGVATLPFEVSSSASSYMIVPLTGNGRALIPMNITTPRGNTINFQSRANNFQTMGAELFGSVNPTIIPAIPQFQNQLESGQHTYRVQTQDSEVCYYIIENTPSNTRIDLNIYLLGMEGINLTPANAASHTDMQAMLNKVGSIFAQAGVSLGTVRFPTVPANVENQYRVIRSDNDIFNLAANSGYPGSDADSALSANVFITEKFAFSGGGSVLGMSLGIPGAAGLHGTVISGVALTGEYMGHTLQTGYGGQRINGNDFTANTLAHELGHFLGLFHTSETTGRHHDPLNDTPECTNFSNPSNCPGATNLMFPLADVGNDNLTPDQSFVIGVNPLTK